MGVEDHREIGRVAQALSEHNRRTTIGSEQPDVETAGLEQPGQTPGVQLHVLDVRRSVGEGHQRGQLAHDLDLVLRPVAPHLFTDVLSVVLSCGDNDGAENQERDKGNDPSAVHGGPPRGDTPGTSSDDVS